MHSPEHNSHDKPPHIHGYELLGKLGQGGKSAVWKARQTLLGRIVVIKVLSEQQTRDPEEIRRFKREALIAAGLKHPGVVQVYDFGQLADSIGYYFVMEFISGYTVGAWFRRKGRLDEAAALTIAYSVAEALLHAWDKAILVHCALKPENIMVDGDGSIKITDLGLSQAAKTLGNPAQLVKAADPDSGTLPYMAPDQIRGDHPVDCRADIYALGATLYHIVTGSLPFGAGSRQEVLDAQNRGAPENPQLKNPALSAGTAAMIMKMMARDAGDRYQNWKDVMQVIAHQEQAAGKGSPASSSIAQSSNADDPLATIPLRGIGDVTDEQAALKACPPSASPDDFKACPYCAEPIRKRAIYCRFCGKDLQKKKTLVSRTDTPRKLKSGLKHVAPPVTAAPSPTTPLPELMPSRSSAFWGGVRMVSSLALISFLCYYAYQKHVNKKDIMVPIREALREMVAPNSPSLQRKPHIRQAPSPAYRPQPIRNKTPQDSAALAQAQLSAWGAAQLPDPPEYIPEESDLAVEANDASAPKGQVPPPLSETEEQRIRNDEEYQQTLRQCKQLRPVVGDEVSLKLKHQKDLLRGTLEAYQSDRLILNIPQGKVSVPYPIMDEQTRRLFFPEDHAMYLYRQKKH